MLKFFLCFDRWHVTDGLHVDTLTDTDAETFMSHLTAHNVTFEIDAI